MYFGFYAQRYKNSGVNVPAPSSIARLVCVTVDFTMLLKHENTVIKGITKTAPV